jgi:ubiquinone biosynthesis protein
MILPQQLMRLFRINRILIKHGLDEVLLHIPIFRPLRFIYYISPWNWQKKTNQAPIGERLRLCLEDLGPIYIKFGQMLSTRNDLVHPDIAEELRKLQDKVAPFPTDIAHSIIEKAYGTPINKVFKHFDTELLASASIAQVYTATLWNDEEVIVKVVRPTIRITIEQDIKLLYLIAGIVNRYWKEARRLHPIEIVQEYEITILDELDLLREAGNASQLRRNFEGSNELYIPKIYWNECRENVLVMERIYGHPIGDFDGLREKNVNMERLGELGVETFFTQVFKHNFFHADMHPGNIFVNIKDPNNPSYIAIDFGIIGTLTPEDQRYIAENMYAFFNRDYKRVAELHVESGWVPSTTRINDFESAIRTVCEPIFNRPLKEISFGYFLLRLFQTARRFDMEVQPQLVLLQKTLLNIEGLGRQLYPDLDLWDTAKPFLQRWVDEQVGIRSLLNGAKSNLPKFIEQVPHMPTLVNDILKNVHDNQHNKHTEQQQLQKQRAEAQLHNKKLLLTLTGSTCLISATITANTALHMDATPNSILFSWLTAGIGVGLLLFAYFKK